MRPTTTPPPLDQLDRAELADDQAAEVIETQGRGDAAEGRPAARTRRKRVPVGGESKGRKLHLPDAIHDRLVLTALQRRTTASAVAAEILDRNLPRLRIERDA